MKPIDAVKRANKGSLFVFEHGLGDLINFLPVYKEFCKQTKVSVKIASSAKRQFHLIFSSIISLDDSLSFIRSQFDYTYRIHYPDSSNSNPPIELHNESAKPYLCAFHELGMSDFTWNPFRMRNQWTVPNSNRVGVHLFGHTGMFCKFCPDSVAELIWKEIIQAGYEPYEVHMIPGFAKEYALSDRGSNDNLSMINKTNSLRFEKPDLARMIEEIGKCKFFIGIDSGPIYLASALLGCERIIGLTNQKRHDNFLPKHIQTIPVGTYKKGSIIRILKQKEKQIL
jgi:hypothetical protein